MRVTDPHKAGRGYKVVSKCSGIHESTVRQIILWVLFLEDGCPVKMTSKAQLRIFYEVKKNNK